MKHSLHDYQNTRVSAYNATNALAKIVHGEISHVGVNFYTNVRTRLKIGVLVTAGVAVVTVRRGSALT